MYIYVCMSICMYMYVYTNDNLCMVMFEKFLVKLPTYDKLVYLN